jgi:hypothetical protein
MSCDKGNSVPLVDKACFPVGQIASVANATYQGLINR